MANVMSSLCSFVNIPKVIADTTYFILSSLKDRKLCIDPT